MGHTHKEVDAAFSQISTKLRQKDVETYDNLLELLPRPTDLKSMRGGRVPVRWSWVNFLCRGVLQFGC